MEAKGLLYKDSEGQYRAKLYLTPAGEEAAAFVEKRASAAVELAGNGLSDSDRTVFYNALEHIAGNLQQICLNGIPE